MSNAYKCDACQEFKEGTPKRYKLAKYRSVGIAGWTDKRNKQRMEVCESCADELETVIVDFLTKNDD